MPAAIETVRIQNTVCYDVYVRPGCLFEVVDKIKTLDPVRHVLVVTDDNVYRLYARDLSSRIARAGYNVLTFVFEPKRKKKSLDTAKEIFRLLFNNRADRHTIILNVGGGTVGDLGGFVAALYLRGVRYIHLPTTLLSQADSGVGGKVNVNFGSHLNSLSVFHHPTAVWVDPDVLQTLPDREYRSGLAEIVKYAVILDAELFQTLEHDCDRLATPHNELVEALISHCLERKCKIVSVDPQEQGPFRFFNYGHEIGHAVEVTYDYEHLLHGEAVSIGMMAASWMGVAADLTDHGVLERQGGLLSRLGLPVVIPDDLLRDIGRNKLVGRIKRVLESDKKRTPKGTLWIVPTHLGQGVCTTEIPPTLVTRCIHRLAEGAA